MFCLLWADEAALYDSLTQMIWTDPLMGRRSTESVRLAFMRNLYFKLTAGYSMRNASVLIVTLRGLAAEVCKNIVLAGIGSLTILDAADVSEEDLGAGYFFRDEDVGKKVRSP